MVSCNCTSSILLPRFFRTEQCHHNQMDKLRRSSRYKREGRSLPLVHLTWITSFFERSLLLSTRHVDSQMKSIGVITTRISINEKLLACKKIESFLKVLITDWIWYQIKNIIKDLWPSSNDIETYIDIKLTYINY